MKPITAGLVAAGTACALFATPTLSHNYMEMLRGPAGYMADIEVRVAHGCGESPVNQVRVKIPEGMFRVRAFENRDWDIEVKMRPVDPPVPGYVGQPITETVDEIIWSNPKSALPITMHEGFKFRGRLPDEPGRILFFRTLNYCEEGDDLYVDLPEENININDEDFAEKFDAFMRATATPSPYMILYKPSLPQYPWEWTSQDIRDAAISDVSMDVDTTIVIDAAE